MATRSAIAYKSDKGYMVSYCHNDGYVEGVGSVLNEQVKTIHDAKKLVDGGDMSTPWEYYNDGEQCKPLLVERVIDLQTFAKNKMGAKFLYVFNYGEWYVCDLYRNDQLVNLSKFFDNK